MGEQTSVSGTFDKYFKKSSMMSYFGLGFLCGLIAYAILGLNGILIIGGFYLIYCYMKKDKKETETNA